MFLSNYRGDIYLTPIDGGGCDVVLRIIDPEEELADFLYQCGEYFDDGTDGSGT